MEFDKFIPFFHELAWPTVALLLAPFALWRLGDIGKVYGVIAEPSFLPKLANETEKLDKALTKVSTLEEKIRSLTQSVISLQTQFEDRETDQIQDASATLSQRDEVEILQASQNFGNAPAQDIEGQYAEMQKAWNDFLRALADKLNSLGKTLDARSVGAAAGTLADRRRSRPLSKEDVSFIANLHGQFKRFARLQSSKNDWLTQDVYSTFLAGTAAAKQMVAKAG